MGTREKKKYCSSAPDNRDLSPSAERIINREALKILAGAAEKYAELEARMKKLEADVEHMIKFCRERTV